MKTVVITGANRGIGLELARLYSKNFEVVALVRKASSELRDLKVSVIENIDVCAEASLEVAKQELAGKNITLLINNAGVMMNSTVENFDFTQMAKQIEVNSLGPLRVIDKLLPLLKTGSKIAMITSRMGSMKDNTSGGSYGYRMSKAALNAAGTSLAVDLKDREIAVALLHPGWVKTDMTGHSGHLTALESAERLSERIAELNLENSGTFWHCNGEVLPW